VKDALVFVVSQTQVVLALLEQVLDHLYIILEERVIQRQVSVVVFDIRARFNGLYNLHVLSVHAYYVLDSLPLVVLLSSCFEKVYLT
jgi:hypothetical protein